MGDLRDTMGPMKKCLLGTCVNKTMYMTLYWFSIPLDVPRYKRRSLVVFIAAMQDVLLDVVPLCLGIKTGVSAPGKQYLWWSAAMAGCKSQAPTQEPCTLFGKAVSNFLEVHSRYGTRMVGRLKPLIETINVVDSAQN